MELATPKWIYNRLVRNINDIETVMTHLDEGSEDYKKLKSVIQSLTGLAVLVKKEAKK